MSLSAAALRGALGVLRIVCKGVGILFVIVLTVALAALFSLDLPPARRFAVRELNHILVTQFKGTVAVTRLGHLGVSGVSGVDAEVTAADGTRVITAHGVAVRVSPFALLKSAIFGKGDLRIRVDDISVDALDADLDTAPDGSLELVGAFDPRVPAAPPKPGARGTDIVLPALRVSHAWVHGVMAGIPPVDADLNHVRGAFLYAPNETKLDVSHAELTVRGLPNGVQLISVVGAHLAMPSEDGRPMALSALLDGSVGEVPVTARATMDGDALDAVLDVPDVTGERVRASVRDAPVYRTVSAHAEAHGYLSNLTTTLHARLGDGSVDLDGTLRAKGALGGTLTLIAKHVDVRTFSETGPTTDLGARVIASAETRADGALVARASIDLPGGTAGGQAVPHTTLQVHATRGVGTKDSPATSSGHLEGIVDEPGAPLALTADAQSNGSVADVSFGAHASVRRLAEVARLGHLGKGALSVTLSGHARVAETVAFEADVDASGQDLEAKGASVHELHLLGKASGSLSQPTLDARVLARRVRASGYNLSRAEVDVTGTPAHMHVAASATGDKMLNLALSSEATLSPAVAFRDATAVLRRGASSLRIALGSVRIGGGSIAASGVAVRGAGEPLLASFRVAPGSLVVRAESRGLDLGKLAYFAGTDEAAGGVLALDVDVRARRNGAEGKVSVDLTKGAWSSVRDAGAHIGLTLGGRHLVGNARLAVGDTGSMELRDLDVHVAGDDPLDARAWRNAWGTLRLAANVDLARVARILPAGALHLTDLAGRVTLAGEVGRDSLADTTPAIHLSVATEGFAAAGQSTAPLRKPGGPLMVGPPTWTLVGMDLRGDLAIDGEGSAGELAVRVVDKAGALISLDAKTTPLPFAALFTGQRDLIARLEQIPISVRLDVPLRDLAQLPPLVRPDGVRGSAAATVLVSGCALAPVVRVAARGRALTVAAAPDTPMDGEIAATYDGSLGTVVADLRSKDEPLLHANASLHAKAKDFLVAGGAPPTWSGSAKATLSRFPLGAIAVLGADQVTGFASGDLEITDLHADGRASATLTLDQLKMGKARFTRGTVGVTVDGGALNAIAQLENASGSLDASAKMGMTWGAKVVPSPDGTGLQAKVVAKHFPAAAAAPFASSAISELSGWVDADANISLLPQQAPLMAGSVTFSDGVIQTPSLGEEFHAVKAKVTLSKEGIVKLEGLEARGLSGKLTASGSAHIAGTTLLGADLALRIAKKEALPLDIQGTNLGSVYGDITVKATGAPDAHALTVAIDARDFHVALPEVGFPRAPQGLADAPGVHIGVYRWRDRFIVLPSDGAPVKLVAERNAVTATVPKSGGVTPSLPMGEAGATTEEQTPKAQPLDLTVHIGDVQVTRGQQVDVHVTGDLRANVAATTLVRGQVRFRSGKIEVQGKEFEVEKGTISFVGDDPANPEINLTAGWTAPDGTRVYADYIGPVKTGKVALRSEPPRPRNEIVSLILFGSADGSSATPYASKSPSTGTQAGTAVGGLATEGLSKGLDQLTGMNVTTKIDTSDSANPRPEVELQIAKNISLELAVVLGTPPPGTNPDTTYATIDWRFVRNWSLATTFGDEGSTFADLVWQYRY